jgi:hypothetical protein
MLTSDGRCSCEIQSRVVMAKTAFNKKRALFTRKMAVIDMGFKQIRNMSGA